MQEMTDTKELFIQSVNELICANIDDADFDCTLLFEETLGLSKRDFFSKDFVISEDKAHIIKSLIERRKKGEPLQYILGYWEFYSRKFFVGEGVLIPRDDTEVVLRATLPHLDKLTKHSEEIKILDLCSGSGILGITLKCEYKNAKVTAVELSKKALPFLVKNAEYNNADIEIINESLYDCADKFENSSLDLLISNPPYIKKSDLCTLQPEVLREPTLALDGGEDGCDFLRGIVSLYTEKIKIGGMLALELDSQQAQYTKALMKQKGFDNIEIFDDLGGIHRAITGIRVK